MPDLIDRYRSNYNFRDDLELTEEQIRRHLELERRLTAELLASSRDERWEVFERCYGELYQELPWLNEGAPERALEDWPALVGPPPRRIYEVGSGQGGLARTLVEAGYEVEATDVTRERGGERDERPGLTWSNTDGIALDRFAQAAPYDAVISDQVVEHLHPDDLVDHLRGALAVLRPGGRYAFRTPHAFLGPADVSRVFDFDRPVGMHLREYTYGELAAALREAGFVRLAAPFGLPSRLRGRRGGARPSGAYLRYLVAVERLLARVPHRRRRRLLNTVLRVPLFRRDAWLVAERPAAGA